MIACFILMSEETNEMVTCDWLIIYIFKYPAFRACAPHSRVLFVVFLGEGRVSAVSKHGGGIERNKLHCTHGRAGRRESTEENSKHIIYFQLLARSSACSYRLGRS